MSAKIQTILDTPANHCMIYLAPRQTRYCSAQLPAFLPHRSLLLLRPYMSHSGQGKHHGPILLSGATLSYLLLLPLLPF
ncbi:uncharacterized protein BO72DRAFT_451121 [Aspergillus fijiensis CBS 313.89]|uniref:Uncharacterized protein n=1 Tax=Aspergillus fijiensis CBS 313.89 TaxID=1448319 RepID=A0A8G1RKC8_9EURO|nr:uncharacterized protein BO72DRAFT_451121 [Aspergillus fijiensis CBS 313.89]RAK74007.1 hypothetical protein BO72DRAFT_451121 [Aspergillus fijiensis CBS 313.89]